MRAGMFKLNRLSFEEGGERISYDYQMDKKIAKYFNLHSRFYVKYSEDVSCVPQSMAVIPLLANIAPISWFVGFDIELDELDEDFYNALTVIKEIFERNFKEHSLSGSIKVGKLIKNCVEGKNTAMLFSGGLDSLATYIRHREKSPSLITVHGADVEIKDSKKWNALVFFLENEPLLFNNEKKYAEANLMNFYTYQVPLLLKSLSWWGEVQYGLGLLGLMAPLSYKNGYKDILIAASNSRYVPVLRRGSMPAIDESVSWGGIKIHHDGYELKRQDKVDWVAGFARKEARKPILRVCYSDLRQGFNCGKCEKCLRTCLGLILAGENPNNYGFESDESIYEIMFSVLGREPIPEVTKYLWKELRERACRSDDFFIYSDKAKEQAYMHRIMKGEIDAKLNAGSCENGFVRRLKFVLINKFPRMYGLYRAMKGLP